MVPFAVAPSDSICTVNSVELAAVTTGMYLSFTKSAEDGCQIEQITLGLAVNDFLNLIVALPVLEVLHGTFSLPDSITTWPVGAPVSPVELLLTTLLDMLLI
jgi:hypothetical protein